MKETLHHWTAQYDEIRNRVELGANYGFIRPEQNKGMTGRQILEAMMAGELPVAPNAGHENFVILEVGEGSVLMQAMPMSMHLNPMGTVHGGWMSLLMDSAMGSAVLSMLPADLVNYSTMNMQTTFLRTMPRDVGAVRVQARVRVELNTNKSVMAEASMFCPNGFTYASATGEFRVPRSALSKPAEATSLSAS